jgi:hypothetical protein
MNHEHRAYRRTQRENVCLPRNRHGAGRAVSIRRLDPTPNGFVLEFEERWEHDGQHWYCREMLRADVSDGRIGALTVYCTGDWDEARQQEFARSI